MKPTIWGIILLCAGLLGCAEKSKVDPLFEAIPLRHSHGDGEYAVFTVKLPLSEQSLDSYESPVDPNSGVARVPLLGDVLRLVTQSTFNFGALLGLGKQHIIIDQPIPDLESPYLKSIAIKRVLFHIDYRDENALPRNWWDRVRDVIRGGSRVNFEFLKEVKLSLRMTRRDGEVTSYLPTVNANVDPRRDLLTPEQIELLPPALRPVELVRYRRKQRTTDLRNGERGPVFVAQAERPVRVRSILKRDERLAPLLEDMVVVNKSLVVQLKKDEAFARELLFAALETEAIELDKAGLKKIEECSVDRCLDLRINDRNMLPLLMNGNNLRIEAFIDASKVPANSFKLKGFIEFEVKLDVPL